MRPDYPTRLRDALQPSDRAPGPRGLGRPRRRRAAASPAILILGAIAAGTLVSCGSDAAKPSLIGQWEGQGNEPLYTGDRTITVEFCRDGKFRVAHGPFWEEDFRYQADLTKTPSPVDIIYYEGGKEKWRLLMLVQIFEGGKLVLVQRASTTKERPEKISGTDIVGFRGVDIFKRKE